MNAPEKLILPSVRIGLIAGRLVNQAEQLETFAMLMEAGGPVQTENNQVALGRALTMASRDAHGCGGSAQDWAERIGKLAAHVNNSADQFDRYGTWSPSEIREVAQHLRMLSRLKPETYRDNGDAA
jgi:hypothetical protein